ncbi:MAG: 3-deoxy-manno-octulosonate cytidylyltransferase [Synergistaceae bacterium]|nr:3-deoxy-manno-octulosonate cytidylyltransferase [Synergistaceae bacterium]
MNLPRILGVIPSRYASTRLEGKPLHDICGKPMVEHVYRRAVLSGIFFRVVIATDDERIYNAVEKFGGDVLMTRADHPDGSSRVAEVARSIDTDYVINIQGDEPMLDPRMLRELAEGIVLDPGADSATVCVPITNEKDFNNPNIVKVVTNQKGRALYFRRSPIPFRRNITECPVWEHLGIYAFTKEFLLKFVELPPTPLMTEESLEQLRILEHGYTMAVIRTKYPSMGPNVNTEEDLQIVRNILAQEKDNNKIQ